MYRIKKIKKLQIFITILIIALVFITLLIILTQQQKSSPSEIYENTKSLNNYTEELKVYVGANNVDDAFLIQERKSVIEDLNSEVYTFEETNILNFAGDEQEVKFELMSTLNNLYFKQLQGGDDSIPQNEWIEIPSNNYQEYNQENIEILKDTFSKIILSNSIYDLGRLVVSEYKNNKYEFDVSNDKDFQSHLEEIHAPIDCYEDAPTILKVEINGGSISKYEIKNNCLFIEYLITNIGNSKFEKLGE